MEELFENHMRMKNHPGSV